MNTINIKTFPVLKTERLVLRQLLESDAELVYKLRTHELVNKYIQRPPERIDANGLEFVLRITKDTANGDIMYWIIVHKENPSLIGSICLWNFNADKTVAEVGFELFPQYQRKGIMTEALNAVLDYGFSILKLNSIEAYTHKDNISSTLLLTRIGFVLDQNRKDLDNLNNIIFIKNNI